MRRPPLAPVSLALALALSTRLVAAEGDGVEPGRTLFATHCEPCHGPTGEAGASGDIRGMTLTEVTRATRGFEQMPAIDLTDAERAAIAAYLKALGES